MPKITFHKINQKLHISVSKYLQLVFSTEIWTTE